MEPGGRVPLSEELLPGCGQAPAAAGVAGRLRGLLLPVLVTHGGAARGGVGPAAAQVVLQRRGGTVLRAGLGD